MDNRLAPIRRHNGPRLYSFPRFNREKAEFIAEAAVAAQAETEPGREKQEHFPGLRVLALTIA
ncbi:hypothetical protein [Bradyrhizobium sp. DOA9]|uniref:hypothetical protein n=1 Tax=Bradyrhizobium sp. DOA9 TaxID=1126627 RepID=UPI000469E704|nr:hypothetical protein [Bradyrhizobium sp. DOA9]